MKQRTIIYIQANACEAIYGILPIVGRGLIEAQVSV